MYVCMSCMQYTGYRISQGSEGGSRRTVYVYDALEIVYQVQLTSLP